MTLQIMSSFQDERDWDCFQTPIPPLRKVRQLCHLLLFFVFLYRKYSIYSKFCFNYCT